MTNQFRIVGHIIYNGKTFPLDIALDIDTLQLASVLMGTLSLPDDPIPARDFIFLEREAEPAEDAYTISQNQPITFEQFVQLTQDASSDYKMQLLAQRFEDVRAETKGPLPIAAKQAPKPIQVSEQEQFEIDLHRLRQTQQEEIAKEGQVVISWVAKALGYPAGGSKWSYLSELSQAYQDELDQEAA